MVRKPVSVRIRSTLGRPLQLGGDPFQHKPVASQDSVDNVDCWQRVSLVAIAARAREYEVETLGSMVALTNPVWLA
jgi:hypothetical protein